MDALKDMVKKGLYHAGYYRLCSSFKAPAENRLLIIMYHDLVEDGVAESDWLHDGKHSRSHFAAQVRFLSSHYRVATVEEAVREMQTAGRLNQPTVAITFDDGHASAYHIAMPVLNAYNVTATIYLLTDWIDRKMIPWWLTLVELLRRWDRRKISPDEIATALGTRLEPQVSTVTDEPTLRRVLSARLAASLRDRPSDAVNRSISDLARTLGVDLDREPPADLPLSWEQIAEMARSGLRFGAHTWSHLNLRHADQQTAEREIAGSKRTIETHLPASVVGFAYPYGMDLAAYAAFRPILQESGFHYAVTAYPGNNDSTADPLALRRITLPHTTSPALIGRTLCLDYAALNHPSDSEDGGGLQTGTYGTEPADKSMKAGRSYE